MPNTSVSMSMCKYRGSFFLSLVVAICPILSLYLAPGTHTPLVIGLLYVSVFLTLKVYNRQLRVSYLFLKLLLAIIFVELVSSFLHSSVSWYKFGPVINNLLFLIIPILICSWWYSNRIELEKFVKLIYLFSFVASIIVIYQKLSYIVTGTYFSNFYIPGLDVVRDDLGTIKARPSAFFSEPAHYAEYVLPITYLSYYQKKWTYAILFTIGILASGSTNGLVGLGVLWLFYFILEGQRKKLINRIFILLLISATILFFNETNSFLSSTFEKANDVDVYKSSRLLGNIDLLNKFTAIDWIWGIGLGNKDAIFEMAKLMNFGDNYLNTYLGVLVHFGILGSIAFLYFLFKLYLLTTKGATKSFFFLFVTICASTAIYMNVSFIMYMIFIVYAQALVPSKVAGKCLYNRVSNVSM